MGQPRWVPTDAELAIIRQHGSSVASQKLGISADTIRRVRRELGIATPPRPKPTLPELMTEGEPAAEDEPEHPRIPEFQQPVWKIPAETTFDNGMWTALESVQREMSALDKERDEVDVELPGDGPIMVVFTSDWHLGHVETDMPRLRRDLETIRNTPGMYCVLGGDLTDNVVTSVASRGMHMEQLTPTHVQKHLIDEAVKFLGKEKVLALILGNHDAWSISNDGFDPIAYYADKIGAPYLGAFGFINVKLGSERYRILAAHQFRMRSSFNKTHQGKRLQDFMGDAQAVFTGHTHDSAAESTHIRQNKCFIGQAGTYLRSSRWSKSLGFTPSTPEMPGIILWPDQRKTFGVYDALVDGPAVLAAFRAGSVV